MWYHVLEVYDLDVLHSKKLVNYNDQIKKLTQKRRIV